MNASNRPQAAALLVTLVLCGTAAAGPEAAKDLVERGRYVVKIGLCNDCHTPGFAESGGTTPEVQWLKGNTVGFQGPSGTTYAANLRLRMAKLSESEWLQLARSATRPPMPWFALRDMSDEDLNAIYRFFRSLGPAGEPAPSYVPPGEAVDTPYIVFAPQNPPEGPQTSQR
jgi:mono/diheme cytochrome c family protein